MAVGRGHSGTTCASCKGGRRLAGVEMSGPVSAQMGEWSGSTIGSQLL